MHYIGMQAFEGPFRLVWNNDYVVASIFVGVTFAALAARSVPLLARRPLAARITSVALLTIAVAGMHFTGMSAVNLVPDPTVVIIGSVFPPEALATAVTAVAFMIVGLGLSSTYIDLYLESKRLDERVRLKAYIAQLEGTQSKLEHAVELASAATKTKSAFLAAMSHELRTPLNAIIGFSELMSSEPFGALGHPRYNGYSEDIRKSGVHLLSLINDILDISRLEANKAELIEEILSVPALLQEAIPMLGNQAMAAGVQFSLALGCELPFLRADNRRVKQIVLNLASNAIKFTPTGGRVQIAAQLREGGVEISVLDTGIGIQKADIPKAFESFGQIDSRLSRKYEGSGLGLPLVKHLVELHGGKIAMESEVDVGTTVRVWFPPERSVAIEKRLARTA
jgi:signal transduction histidine kinase